MKSYIQKIRNKLGHDKLIHPAARIIVENEHGQILIIERADNGHMGIPAGALEENESIEECIIREVKEETGINILHLEVIGIASNPNQETVQYPNGDVIQYFTIEFYSNQWEGEINIKDPEEVNTARFADPAIASNLPQNERSAFESRTYYQKHGKVMLK
jgi:ADP-ribose pyrophosphatase YjhB (NUDIX family)